MQGCNRFKMTDDSVSKSKRRWFWKAHSPWPKLLVISLVVSLAGAWITFVTMRIYAGYRTEAQWDQFRDDLADSRRAVLANRQDFERRLSDLEQTVYAVLEPRSELKPKVLAPRSSTELWQRNRDAELQRRLLQLERWRMEVEAQK